MNYKVGSKIDPSRLGELTDDDVVLIVNEEENAQEVALVSALKGCGIEWNGPQFDIYNISVAYAVPDEPSITTENIEASVWFDPSV